MLIIKCRTATTSDKLKLGARGAGELVVHNVLEHCPGGVVVTERVQPVAVRIAQTVFEEQEYGQRDEQHGQCRIVGHNNMCGAFYAAPGRVRCRSCVLYVYAPPLHHTGAMPTDRTDTASRCTVVHRYNNCRIVFI